MSNSTDYTEIAVADLQFVRAALNSAYNQNTVIDLSEQYRKLSQRLVSSKLTLSLKGALGVVDEYIDIATVIPQTGEDTDEPEA